MTMTLFDQEYAEKIALADARREGGIESAVEMCQQLGQSFNDTINIIAQKFGFSVKRSSEYVKTYWKGQIPVS